MLSRVINPKVLSRTVRTVLVQVKPFSDVSRGGRRTLKPLRRTTKAASPAPAPLAVHDAWQEVVDKPSGQIYYWNTVTNETTALGAPKPTAGDLSAEQQPQQASGGMMSGLGRVVAEGFAFGVGSSVAHGVVGSIFGGGSSNSSSDDGGSDDSFDI